MHHSSKNPEIVVRRAETGHFELTHAASGAVVIDESLADGFARIEAMIGERADAPAPPSRAGARPVVWALVGLWLLLPFAWYGALELALGRAVAALRVELRGPPRDDAARDRELLKRTRLEIGALDHELRGLGERVATADRLARAAKDDAARALSQRPQTGPEGEEAANSER